MEVSDKSKNDFKNFSGTDLNLLNTHMNMMKYQLRLKLLRSLLNKKLATRDVYYFARGQAEQKMWNKNPDHATIVAAMKAKILDVKTALHRSYLDRNRLRVQLAEEYSDRKSLFRGKIRQHLQTTTPDMEAKCENNKYQSHGSPVLDR